MISRWWVGLVDEGDVQAEHLAAYSSAMLA